MYQTNFARLGEIGKEGVLALLSTSSNAENPTPVASELTIADEVSDTIFYWEGRIIVAMVASNLQRLQQVLNAAHRADRKVVLTGQDFGRFNHHPKRDETIPSRTLDCFGNRAYGGTD